MPGVPAWFEVSTLTPLLLWSDVLLSEHHREATKFVQWR